MPNALITILFILPAMAAAEASPVRYDQIPSDATGYIYIDFDRLLSSRLLRESGEAAEAGEQIDSVVGRHAGFAIYSPKTGGPGGFVMLIYRSAPALRQKIEAGIASAGNSVEFTYGKHSIHYTPASPVALLYSLPPPPKTTTPTPEASKPAKTSGSFTLGLGGSNQVGQNFTTGPCYVTFVGTDLILVAGDVPAVAGAIDVIEGRKPSLDQQDPQGLKGELPSGMIATGAGLTAQLAGTNPEQATPSRPAVAGNNFTFDLFGSFKGKANLARFDFGEDDQNVYVDGLFAMKDPEAATQLSKLLSGMKALIYLSQAEVKPLLDPVEVKAADKDVKLRWTWPTGKLPELFRLLDQQNPSPTTAPSDQKLR
jgi:hypothetical protein